MLDPNIILTSFYDFRCCYPVVLLFFILFFPYLFYLIYSSFIIDRIALSARDVELFGR